MNHTIHERKINTIKKFVNIFFSLDSSFSSVKKIYSLVLIVHLVQWKDLIIFLDLESLRLDHYN